jgi:hypothetical protein
VVDEPAAAPEGAGAGRTSQAIPAAPARAATPSREYQVIEIRMNWRGETDPQTGPQALTERLNEAAKDGWRLDRLQFNNIPQGDGYNDLVTAYAVMVRGARTGGNQAVPRAVENLIRAAEALLKHRECPVQSPEAAALATAIRRARAATGTGPSGKERTPATTP